MTRVMMVCMQGSSKDAWMPGSIYAEHFAEIKVAVLDEVL